MNLEIQYDLAQLETVIEPGPNQMSDNTYQVCDRSSWMTQPENLTESALDADAAERFRLENYAPEVRVDVWRDIVSRTFAPLSPEPLKDSGEFGARLDTISRADVKLSHISGTAQRVLRGPQEISQSRASTLFMNVQLEGHSLVRHARGEAVMQPGDCVLINPHEPFTLEFGAAFRQLSIQLPDWWVNDQADLPMEAMAGVCVNLWQGSGRILASSIDSLVSVAAEDQESSRELALLLGDVVNRTMSTAARRHQGSHSLIAAPGRNALLLRQFVEQHFQEESLSPMMAAQALGCSVRNVHKISMMMGTSFGRLLLEKRLVAAARMLTFTNSPARIGEIAYECGFSDLSHFSRAFKQRFGVSPRMFRGSAPHP